MYRQQILQFFFFFFLVEDEEETFQKDVFQFPKASPFYFGLNLLWLLHLSHSKNPGNQQIVQLVPD